MKPCCKPLLFFLSNYYYNHFIIIRILLLLFLFIISSSCRFVNSSLEEPTLVGVKECTELSNVRLPLYWSSKYSLDQKGHHGPKDISTIIIGDGSSSTTTTKTKTNSTQRQLPSTHTYTSSSSSNHRHLLLGGRKHPNFGQVISDGTIRTSVTDVSKGARVIVLMFIYADLHQCSTLVKDLSELIDEVNAEYYVAKHSSSTSSIDSSSSNKNNKKNNKNIPPIMGVALNNIWPLQCDEQEDKCSSSSSTNDTTNNYNAILKEEEWQGKIMSAAPKIPILQDISSVQAWDTVFGAYYMDLIIYLDGKVYQYVPSALAISHSTVLSTTTTSMEEAATSLNLHNPEQLKATLLRALDYPTKWCEEEEEGNSTSLNQSSGTTTNTDNSTTSSSASSKYSDDQTMSESEYYDVILGFIFAMLAIFVTIVGSLCIRCCCKFWERILCCPSTRRRLALDEDRLGEFRPLAMEDEYYNDELKFIHNYNPKQHFNNNDDDDDPDRYEYGMDSDEEEDYSLPMQKISNPNRAAENFFQRQEAAEREITLQEALEQPRNVLLDDDNNDEYLMSSLDLEMIERKIVESIGNSSNRSV